MTDYIFFFTHFVGFWLILRTIVDRMRMNQTDTETWTGLIKTPATALVCKLATWVWPGTDAVIAGVKSSLKKCISDWIEKRCRYNQLLCTLAWQPRFGLRREFDLNRISSTLTVVQLFKSHFIHMRHPVFWVGVCLKTQSNNLLCFQSRVKNVQIGKIRNGARFYLDSATIVRRLKKGGWRGWWESQEW